MKKNLEDKSNKKYFHYYNDETGSNLPKESPLEKAIRFTKDDFIQKQKKEKTDTDYVKSEKYNQIMKNSLFLKYFIKIKEYFFSKPNYIYYDYFIYITVKMKDGKIYILRQVEKEYDLLYRTPVRYSYLINIISNSNGLFENAMFLNESEIEYAAVHYRKNHYPKFKIHLLKTYMFIKNLYIFDAGKGALLIAGLIYISKEINLAGFIEYVLKKIM